MHDVGPVWDTGSSLAMKPPALVPQRSSAGLSVHGGGSVARAARNSSAVKAMARVGLAARGATYLIIASIAAQIAVGGTSQSADQHGALEDVASRPFGRLLLIAMAAGFAAYARPERLRS